MMDFTGMPFPTTIPMLPGWLIKLLKAIEEGDTAGRCGASALAAGIYRLCAEAGGSD